MVGHSLDRFINKSHKKYFIHAKRSRLEVKKISVWFSNGKKQNGVHLKTRPKFCPKNDHSKIGQYGIGLFSVVDLLIMYC
jgi:hypothetical protein